MKYQTAPSFRQAIEQRLLNQTRETALSIVRLRKTIVFDRLLARLSDAAPGRWMLKGALALDFRLRQRSRATKDMDLVRRDNEEEATADLIAAAAVDLGDFFRFAIERRERLREEDGGGLVRYQVRAELAGRLFEDVIVDIGFSNPLGWPPELVTGSDVLTFAGIEPIQVPVLPLEAQVAEKVHAYTRRYGGHRSSRAKVLVDLVLVKRSMGLDGKRLRTALLGTFEGRGQHSMPKSLPPPPAEWAVAYRKLATSVDINPELAVGHAEAAVLIDPILAGRDLRRWEPDRGGWIEI